LYHADFAYKSTLKHRYYASKMTKINHDVIQTIDAALKIDLSPEQIAGRTKLENLSQSVSMHTIYRFIRSQGCRSRLPRGGKKYRRRTATHAGAKLIPNHVDIEQRSVDVDLKKTVGHWEADTVHASDGYFVSLVERKTKLFLFQRIQRKTKSEVAKAVIRLLKPFKKKCDSMTFDNGGEFADHEFIAKRLKCRTYFAKPYHAWQRGLNENSNGLLRRYFPKKTSIASISEQYLADVN